MSFMRLFSAIVAALLFVTAIVYGGVYLWAQSISENDIEAMLAKMEESQTQVIESLEKAAIASQEKHEKEIKQRNQEFAIKLKEKQGFLRSFSITNARRVSPTDDYQERYLAQFENHSPKTVISIQFQVTYLNEKNEMVDTNTLTMYIDPPLGVAAGGAGVLQWWRSVKEKDSAIKHPLARHVDVKLIDVKVVD
ncbi:MAG: hypothetical protein J0M34_01925 [Alphaproteobacteria bacterium]|nr:hypothetical protein [Alphaproteobacteria bacterium]